MKLRTNLFPLLVSFALFSCTSQSTSQKHLHHAQFFAFGTTIELSIYGVDEALAKQAEQKAKEDFAYMHRVWHPYESGPLMRINSLLLHQSKFSFAPSVRGVILEARKYARMSEHYFNPAMGALITLWGFHQPETLEGRTPPADSAIQAMVANMPTMDDLQIDGVEMVTQHPQLALDFGGIAKGFGIDRAIDELRKMGIENAIVNAGGDLRAIGSKGGKPWVIGIRHPRNNGVMASIEISRNESVFTSGDYERYFDHEGQRYHHILSPFTGYPTSDFQSVTVVSDKATLADAAATALSVAGEKQWQRIAKKMQVDQLMFVLQSGKVIVSEQLAGRIEWINVDENNIEVVPL